MLQNLEKWNSVSIHLKKKQKATQGELKRATPLIHQYTLAPDGIEYVSLFLQELDYISKAYKVNYRLLQKA